MSYLPKNEFRKLGWLVDHDNSYLQMLYDDEQLDASKEFAKHLLEYPFDPESKENLNLKHFQDYFQFLSAKKNFIQKITLNFSDFTRSARSELILLLQALNDHTGDFSHEKFDIYYAEIYDRIFIKDANHSIYGAIDGVIVELSQCDFCDNVFKKIDVTKCFSCTKTKKEKNA